jgi:peptidoglycan/LPS O-acetylase OafA/YrhL
LKRLDSAGLAVVGVLAWLGGLVAPAVYTHLDPDHLGHPLRLGDEVLWSWYLKFSPVTHVGCFVIGVVAGALFLRHRDALARVGAGKRSFVVGALLLFAVELLVSQIVPYAYLYADVLAPLYALLVVALAGEGPAAALATRALASEPAVALGRASYAIYILHVPVFYVFAHFIPDMWDEGALFWPYLVTLLIVSGVVYRFVEEPARRSVRRGLTRALFREERAPAAFTRYQPEQEIHHEQEVDHRA